MGVLTHHLCGLPSPELLRTAAFRLAHAGVPKCAAGRLVVDQLKVELDGTRRCSSTNSTRRCNWRRSRINTQRMAATTLRVTRQPIKTPTMLTMAVGTGDSGAIARVGYTVSVSVSAPIYLLIV